MSAVASLQRLGRLVVAVPYLWLALFFLAMGALVQHGTGVAVATQGGDYITQLIDMYGSTPLSR